MNRFSKAGVPTLLLSAGVCCGISPLAHAGVSYGYANQVVSGESSSGSYTSGWQGQINSNAGSAYYGPTNGQTGSGHYYLTPFEPAYTAATATSTSAYLATISPGSTLVLQFPTANGLAASTSATLNGGFTLGIHAGVGLTDTSANSSNSYSGNGVAGSPASSFNNPRISYLAVGNGTQWAWYAGQTLNSTGTQILGTLWTALTGTVPTLSDAPSGAAQMTFNDPSAYYASTAVYPDGGNNTITPPAGTPLADPSQAFTGTLNAFSGDDYSQVVQELNGSAGGDWFNLSNTGLNQITQIAFVVPGSVSAGSPSMYVQAVVGVVPESSSLGLLAVGGVALLLLPRRRGKAV